MNQDEDFDNDHSQEHWFSRFENECLCELEDHDGVESRVQSIEEHTAQQLWLGFQQTSTAIAQLYNCKESSSDSYVVLGPFNKAAESLTKFYKDSVNNARESLRMGIQCGRSNRSRELAAWARKKRKHIRRDELLAYLCGKSLPQHRARQNRGHERSLTPRISPHHTPDGLEGGDFPVMDSYSLQGLNGAMANIGFSRSSTSATHSHSSVGPHVVGSHLSRDEHHLMEDPRDRSEHRKRANSSSSSMDVSMDSPSRKKGRFL